MSDPVHKVIYQPETGRTDVYLGPDHQKPRGAPVLQEHELHYLRGAGTPPPPSTIDTGFSVPQTPKP